MGYGICSCVRSRVLLPRQVLLRKPALGLVFLHKTTRRPIRDTGAGKVKFAALGEPGCLLCAAAFLEDREGAALRGEPRGPEARRAGGAEACLLYTSPSPRDRQKSRMPSSA